ncbi:hypothetical protein K2P96_00970 [Patescibacteria group bacterium]|nr:hypothetical protein [Patescibacteria group bacterium]
MEEFSRNAVHYVLAHSYSFYFFIFILSVFLDLTYPFRVLKSSYATPLGFIILVLSSLLILWAQRTSRNLKKETLTKESFCKGPYCYTRSPTHWGLFLLTLGFGVIANAFFVMLFSVISFIITRVFFIKKEEELLIKKYGTPYIEYQKLIKF